MKGSLIEDKIDWSSLFRLEEARVSAESMQLAQK
jgi:hypothetical protein